VSGSFALGDLVQRGDQGFEFGAVEELHLVEQEDDAGLVLGRRFAEGDEEVGEVVAEVAGVGAAEHGLDVDADLEPFWRAQRERLEDRGGAAGAFLHPLGRADREQRPACEPGDQRPELGLVGDLALGGAEARLFGDRLEGVQEHGLADAAQAGDEHALLRPPELEAGEQDAEGLDLLVAAGQRGRARPGPGRVGVADRVDAASVATYTGFIRIK
jgi:hypothetical protein